HEREQRLSAGLSERQIENLDRWGYPYVFEDFRFHLTLTGPIDAERRASILALLQARFNDIDGGHSLPGVANEAIIDVRRVSKTFERGTRVLDDVSFSVDCREMVALIGASGSGKSTLIRALAGLVAVDKTGAAQARAGTIAIFGRPIQRDGRIARGAKEL